MVKLIKIIPLVLTVMFMNACSTTSKKTVDPDAVMLSSTSIRKGLTKWAHFNVEAIDNNPARRTKNKLRAGMHNVVLYGSFNRGGFSSGPFQARGDVDVNLLPGREYIATGTVKGSKMLLWISDARTKQAVSEVLTIPYTNTPESNTTFIPLYIPS